MYATMISIVVPTCNRVHYLSLCLASLHREKEAIPHVEVVVVDDGSSDNVKEQNRQLCAGYCVRYIPCRHNRGMAVARNVGIQAARGEWVVFIDDDVTVDEGWGGALAKLLAGVSAEVVGIEGKVCGIGTGLWDREVEVTSGGSCLTCHIAYRKKALLAAGCFDEQFEHEGPFHEDQELAVRMLRIGKIVFEPSIVALHMPRKVHLLQYLVRAHKRIEQVLRADYYFYRKHPVGYRRFRHARTFFETYRAVLFKYAYTTIRRREAAALLRHPLQTAVLAASCLAAQMRAWTMLPYFLARPGVAGALKEVWFAAAIPSNSQGGVRRLMMGLADGLVRSGYTVKLVCHHFDRGGYFLFSLMLAVRLAARLFNPPDVIIARSTDAFFPLLLRKLLPLKTRILLQNHGWEEYVYEVQQRLPATLVNNPVTWKAHLLRFPMLRATLRMADCCLCGTIDDARWIGRKYPRARKKLRYVPNGVALGNTVSPFENSTVPYDFLTVGTLTWRKNYPYAFELFYRVTAECPQARLYCVGTGSVPGSHVAAKHAINVSFIPVVPMQDMESWYARCPFFIHTSRYEGGHALVLLEAMSYGAVCFVSPISSNLEVIVHGHNGVVLNGGAAEKDARLLVATLNNRELLQKLSVNARHTARRHRWERQTARLVRVLGGMG